MNRLVLCRKHLGLLGLGLTMLLTGCNSISLTGNKLYISEKFPKNLVVSQTKIFKDEIDEKNTKETSSNKIDLEKISSCMVSLMEGKGLTGSMNLIPKLFNHLGNISPDNPLVGFHKDISISDLFKDKGIINLDLGENKTINVFKELLPKSEKTNEQKALSLRPFEQFLNLDLIEMIGTKNIDKNKMVQLRVISELYLTAYFRSAIGNVEQIADESFKEISKEISEKIKKKSSSSNKSGLNSAFENIEQTVENSLKEASEKIKKASNSTDKSGFVSGDGSKYSFSALSSANRKLSIDHNQIGADVVRILLEAARDTFYPLPVSKDSTLALGIKEIQEKHKEKFENFKVFVFNEENEKGNGKLWEGLELGKIDDKKLNEIVTQANQSEAEIATLVGKAIRGGLIGSLNNEALAKVIETAAGVVARQTRERLEWCTLAQEQENAGKDTQKRSEADSVLLIGL